jgi:predicted transcriptional regulator
MSSFKQLLENLAKEKAPGPSASFSAIHLLLALETVAEKQVGRKKLAEELRIGEGAVRTLLERLRSAKLIQTSKTGCALTPKGRKLVSQYQSFVKRVKIEKSELTLTDFNYAVLVKNGAQKVKTGIEQRDAAVMAGAKNATTVLCKNGRLVFPFANEQMNNLLKASTQITGVLKPEENDAIIIVGSDRPEKAEYGALAAAWTLLDNDTQ